MDIFFKKAAEVADGVLDLANWFGNRIESKKTLVKPQDLIGLLGEVTATIKPGAVGEVVVAAGEARLNYSARADKDDTELKKGETVKVVRAGSSLLYVVKESNEKGGGHTCCNHDH